MSVALSNAFALRPLRIDVKKNKFIHYEATTFPRNPAAGCEMMLRRVLMFGAPEDSPVAVDILAENGDILDTVNISRGGFEYLRRTLKFKRERHDEWAERIVSKAKGEGK